MKVSKNSNDKKLHHRGNTDFSFSKLAHAIRKAGAKKQLVTAYSFHNDPEK